MTERMYGGYPESCIREGHFQLEGEQVMEITRDLLAENAALQAKIDALMLEYCPDEMTPEQIEEWKRHQVPSEALFTYSPERT